MFSKVSATIETDQKFCEEFDSNIQHGAHVKYSGIHIRNINESKSRKSYEKYITAEMDKIGKRTMENMNYVYRQIKDKLSVTNEQNKIALLQLELARREIDSNWLQSEMVAKNIAELQPYFAQKKKFDIIDKLKFLIPMCEEALDYLSELVSAYFENIKIAIDLRNSNIVISLETYIPDKIESVQTELENIISQLTNDYFEAEVQQFKEESNTGQSTPSGLPISFYNTENRCWAPSKAALERRIFKFKLWIENSFRKMHSEAPNDSKLVKNFQEFAMTPLNNLPKSLIAPCLSNSWNLPDRAKEVTFIAALVNDQYKKYFNEMTTVFDNIIKRIYGLVFRITVNSLLLKDLRNQFFKG